MATVRTNTVGGTRYYQVRHGARSAVIFSSQNKRLATDACTEFNRQLERERAGLPPDGGPSRARWALSYLFERCADYFDSHTAPRTAYDYRRRMAILLRELGDVSLDRISRTTIDSYPGRRMAHPSKRTKRPVGPAPVNRELSVLRECLKLAREWREESGYIADPFSSSDPLHRWRPLDEKTVRRVGVALTPAEVWEVRAIAEAMVAEAHPSYAREYRDCADALHVLFMTASRIDQVLRAERSWIDPFGFLNFPAHKRGKPRVFPIDAELGAILARRPSHGRYLFPADGRPGKPRTGIRKFWTKLRERMAEAGITAPLLPHDCRHTAITRLLEFGGSVADATRLGGWTSPQMVHQTYSHIRPDAVSTVNYGAPPEEYPAGRSLAGRAETTPPIEPPRTPSTR
jgi:integrase